MPPPVMPAYVMPLFHTHTHTHTHTHACNCGWQFLEDQGDAYWKIPGDASHGLSGMGAVGLISTQAVVWSVHGPVFSRRAKENRKRAEGVDNSLMTVGIQWGQVLAHKDFPGHPVIFLVGLFCLKDPELELIEGLPEACAALWNQGLVKTRTTPPWPSSTTPGLSTAPGD